MISLRRKILWLSVPAVLAAGAITYGSVVAFATPGTTRPASSLTQPVDSTAADSPVEKPEQPESAVEQPEPNEPALPGGGHADTSAQANHEFDGVE